jgi:hypothetical protein
MPAKPIIHSFAYALDYLCEQIADVAPADMVTHPAGIVNHPAWTVGHLAFTCQMIGGVIGVSEWLPSDFGTRFGSGSVPVADASKYESKEQLIGKLRDAQSRIAHAVEGLSDARLDQPFPDPAYLDVFPTVRHALTQVLVAHTAFHVGQVSIWRRAMKLAPMRRSFE